MTLSVLAAMVIWCSPGVVPTSAAAPLPWLHPDAAQAFHAARVEIRAATGTDARATLGDALRWPQYATDKPGVVFRSWHKAGRAIDLDQRLPWVVVPCGAMYRVWLHGVDVTAILERHGWSRIPAQAASPAWWHDEYLHGAGTWDAAMMEAWPNGAHLSQASCQTCEIAHVTPVGPVSHAALHHVRASARWGRLPTPIRVQHTRIFAITTLWATTAQQTRRTHMRLGLTRTTRHAAIRGQDALRATRWFRLVAIAPFQTIPITIRKEDV